MRNIITLTEIRVFRHRFDASMRQAFIAAGLDPDAIEIADPSEKESDVEIPEKFKPDLRALGIDC